MPVVIVLEDSHLYLLVNKDYSLIDKNYQDVVLISYMNWDNKIVLLSLHN